MSHSFDYEAAERSSLIERCRAFETLHSAEHALCMSTFKERDTYRDLCVDLLQALILHQELTRPIDNSSIAITKAESILGEQK